VIPLYVRLDKRFRHISPRVYVLLDIIAGKSDWVVRSLRSQPGVVLVAELEDQPRVIMVVEAGDRQKLAELTIQTLSSVDSLTEGIQLLPAKSGRIAVVPTRSSARVRRLG